MGYVSYKEKRESARYANVDPMDYIDCTILSELANLYRYNRKVWNKVNDLRNERDRKIAAIKIKGCTIKWQQCSHKELPQPSAAEQLIIDQLVQYPIQWFREVEFLDHRKTDYGLYRYDFFIPAIMLVVEYDGKYAHSTPEQIANDAEKSSFCKNNGVRIVRWSAKQYYHMEKHVRDLLAEYSIRKK